MLSAHSSVHRTVDHFFSDTLFEADPEIAAAIAHERERQQSQIELIASENIVSRAVLEAQGSVMTNKYAEGYPGRRYYGGCEFDDVGAHLMVDMAHFAGLVAGGVYPSPLPHAHVVTTTTHKTLRGPRGGLILASDEEIGRRINSAVFPALQGGPLMHVIAAKAVALGEALQPAFRHYAKAVVENAKALAATLVEAGLEIVSGGTDSHLMLVDLRPLRLTGPDAAITLERA